MKNADKIISDCTADKEFDLFIAQDCVDLGRLGDAAKYFEHAKKTACIDHHISNQSFADEVLICLLYCIAKYSLAYLIGQVQLQIECPCLS